MKLWTSPLASLRVAVVISAALAAGVYANSVSDAFAYDDFLIIVENHSIQNLASLPGALFQPYWGDQWGRELGLWRPGATALYGLQWIAFDGNPVWFHLVSIALHTGATALVLLLLARLIPLGAAFLGGLVFAVHPVHTEAVANVVGQSEVAAAAAYLAACLVYLRAPPEERLGTRRVLALCFFFGLAFAFKEMAATLPGILVLLDGARRDSRLSDLGDYLRSRGSALAAVTVTGLVFLLVRYQVLGSVAHPFAPMGADILEEVPRIWTVAGLWPHYVRLPFFPLDLSSDYAPLVVPILYGWSVENILGLVIALLFLALAWASWRRSSPMDPERRSMRALGFGILWFVITISPVSNFFFLSGVLISERSMYLPSVGFVLGVGWVLGHLLRERRALGWVTTLAVVMLLGCRTWARNPDWGDNLTVFDVMVRDHPESGRAQWVLGDAYYARGDMSRALRAYRLAVGLLGTEYPLLTQIAARLAESGKPDEAEILLRFAWEQQPQFKQAPGLLATVLFQQGRYQEAEEAARAALEGEQPGDPLVHHILSLTLAAQERYEEAVAPRRAAIRLGEDRPEQWTWLGDLYLQAGDTAQALEALDSAMARVRSPDQVRHLDSLRVDWSGDRGL